jgi:hypothetical protein
MQYTNKRNQTLPFENEEVDAARLRRLEEVSDTATGPVDGIEKQ